MIWSRSLLLGPNLLPTRLATGPSEVGAASMSNLKSTPEWAAYSAAPEGPTFHALVRRTGEISDELLQLVSGLAASGGNWKALQHASLLFEQRGYATEAHYFARRSLAASNADIGAHIAMARVMELRRFPYAALHELGAIRALRPGVRDQGLAERVDAYLASAYVRTYAYVQNLDLARPWTESLRRSRFAEINAFEQLFHAAFHDKSGRHGDLLRLAALRVAELAPSQETRTGGKLDIALKGMLMSLLRSRT